MLVLTRKAPQTIHVGGGEIRITVVRVRGRKVQIGIDAPPAVDIVRGELLDELDPPPRRPRPGGSTLTAPAPAAC